MRLRLALAAALPALLALGAMALLADRLARRALEEELGARLVAVAQSAAAGLAPDRVEALGPGDEGSRTHANVSARLAALAQATGTRLRLVRLDRTAIADSERRLAIGAPVPSLEPDRFELSEVAKGKALASQLLVEGADGELYKTGYAPLAEPGGRVVAAVAADGTARSFVALRRFRRLLVGLALAGALLAALTAALATLSLVRPLRTLAASARRIGGGDLETALPAAAGPGELETLRATLEEMRQALRDRDRERETMLAGIAHEVRNPLGAMALFAGALADDLKDRPEAVHLARVRSEIDALGRVVEEFLAFARPRSIEPEPIDAARLAEEVADLAAPLAAGRGVGLRASGSGSFSADRAAVRRAALNLVRNAVEASPASAGAEVELSCSADRDGQGLIQVLDRGPGLSPEARSRLFEPFFTTRERGTGLGLALARRTAAAHGGELTVRDRPDGGTAARLHLPRREPKPEPGARRGDLQ